jgi:tellurite resistance protein TerA
MSGSSRFNLEKVSLSKPGERFNLTKEANSEFKEININLNWNQGEKKIEGFWNTLLGRTRPSTIDLDLGCLYELQSGACSAVQALGNAFGNYNAVPYIELSGDDRSGANAEGETLLINGARWDRMKRVLIHASIYDGVANWGETDGRVLINVSGQRPVEVNLTHGDNRRRVCAIATLENVRGDIEITRHVKYYEDVEQMDRAFNWGLHWVAGSK